MPESLTQNKLDMGLCNLSEMPHNLSVAITVSAVIGIGLDPGERLTKKKLTESLLGNLADLITVEPDPNLIDEFEIIDIQQG